MNIENQDFIDFLNGKITFNDFVLTIKSLKEFSNEHPIFSFLDRFSKYFLDNKNLILSGKFDSHKIHSELVKINQEIQLSLISVSKDAQRSGESDFLDIEQINLAKSFCDKIAHDICEFFKETTQDQHYLDIVKLNEFRKVCYDVRPTYFKDRNWCLKFYKFFYPSGKISNVNFASNDISDKKRSSVIRGIINSDKYKELFGLCKYLSAKNLFDEIGYHKYIDKPYFFLFDAFYSSLKRGLSVHESKNLVFRSLKRISDFNGVSYEVMKVAHDELFDHPQFIEYILSYLANKGILVKRK